MRIHDLRQSLASQGVMNGEGLPTVGRLLGHRFRATTAIYAHLDHATLQDASAQAAASSQRRWDTRLLLRRDRIRIDKAKPKPLR